MVTSPGARYSYCDCLPIIKVAVGNSAESDHGLDASSLRSSLAATALHSLVQTPTRVLLRVSVGGGPVLCSQALKRQRRGRWRLGGDPRPSAHLKLSAAWDWREQRGPGEGFLSGDWRRGAPVTVQFSCRPAPAPPGPK